MQEIFVDTGAWLALADKRDQYHGRATAVYPQLLSQTARLITTNLVVAESYNLIRRRLGYEPGMRFLQSLRQSSRLERVYADMKLEIAAEAILKQYSDQAFSLVDAVSFALMQQRDIQQTFAFDAHFQVMGFIMLPG
jgi:predicted nucleic acid-binding protein